MHCPKCGYEYREGILTCPDCDEDLVEEPLEKAGDRTSDESDSYDWINIARLTSWETAEMLIEALRTKGIPAVVLSKSGHFGQFGAIPVAAMASGKGGYLIWVPAEFVSDADREAEMILGEEWVKARIEDMGE